MIGRIPVCNLWLLFLYANDLARWEGPFDMAAEEDDADLATLVGRLLASAAEERLRRNLGRSYVRRSAVLSRVRGRIDVLATEAHGYLSRGLVVCRFEELSIGTPRNHLVRKALRAIANRCEPEVAHRCRTLSGQLRRIGASNRMPSRAELAGDAIGRNDAADRLVVALARLALELALPTEDVGAVAGTSPGRDAVAARKLFERAVGGFYRSELAPEDGWSVRIGSHVDWGVKSATGGLSVILPGMITDVALTDRPSGRRIVIDTKSNGVLAPGRWGARSIRSGHVFQMYAYLRSQVVRGDALADGAEGLLSHPTVEEEVMEAATFQGHRNGFATVNLAAEASAIGSRLLEVVGILSPRVSE